MADQTERSSLDVDADLRRIERELQRAKAIGDQFTSSLARGLEGVVVRGDSLRQVFGGLGVDLSRQVFQSAMKPLTTELQRASGLGSDFGRSLTKAFDSVVVRGKNLKDVVRSLAQDLSQVALKSAFDSSKPGIGTLLQGLLTGGLGGGGITGSGLGFSMPFARGGVVSSPTFFPISGGRTGVMGERGAEAILPLQRGADGRLGVAADGGSGTINVNFTVNSPDADSFQRSETQISAMLARVVSRGQRNL